MHIWILAFWVKLFHIPNRNNTINQTMWTREQIAQKAAVEVGLGQIVNLGIGIPTLVANYIEADHAFIHSENGLLGMGPFPKKGEEDPQIINACKQTVTILPRGSLDV